MNILKNTNPIATKKRKRDGEEIEQTLLKKTRKEKQESNHNRVEASNIKHNDKKEKNKNKSNTTKNKKETEKLNVEKQKEKQRKKISKRLNSLNQLLELQKVSIRTQLKTWAGKLLYKTIGNLHNTQRKKHMENNPTFLPKSNRFGFKLIQKPALEGNTEYQELEKNTEEIMQRFKKELRSVIVATQLLEESADLKQHKLIFTKGLTELFSLCMCYQRRKCVNMEVPEDDEVAGKVICSYFMNHFIFKEECSLLRAYLHLEPKSKETTTSQSTCFITAAEAERNDTTDKENRYKVVSNFISNSYLKYITEITVNLTERYKEERAEEEVVARTEALLENMNKSSATIETLNAIKAEKIVSPTTIGEMIEDSVVKNVSIQLETSTDTEEEEITTRKTKKGKPKNTQGARANQMATSLTSTGPKGKGLEQTQHSLNLTHNKHSSLSQKYRT